MNQEIINLYNDYTLLIRLHKDGDYSDTAIKQIEREIDIDELQLNGQLPKEE